MPAYRKKKPARRLQGELRSRGRLTPSMILRNKKRRVYLAAAAIVCAVTGDPRFLLRMCALHIRSEYFIPIYRPPGGHLYDFRRTIDSFSEEEVYEACRFTRAQLKVLLRAFRLDDLDRVSLDNRSSVDAEEILLMALYRFGGTMLTFSQLRRKVFGFHSQTVIARAVKWFVDFMLREHSHLLTDTMSFWVHRAERDAKSIADAMNDKFPALNLNRDRCRIAWFIDGTVISTCKPDHPDNRVQQAAFSGHKKTHCVKYLSVETVNGMCAYLGGPYPGRRNDLDMLRMSGIDDRLIDTQEDVLGLGDQDPLYRALGDGIFMISRCITRYHSGGILTDRQLLENEALRHVRGSVENSFSSTNNILRLTTLKSKLKLIENRQSAYYYIVSTLIRNAWVSLNHGQVSKRFFRRPPEIMEYFGLERE